MIPHGAPDKPKELVVSIIKNQEEALEGTFDFVSQKRNLSSSYIKELHQVFNQNQEEVSAVDGLGRKTNVQLLKGDLTQLVALIVALQKKSFIKALSISEDILKFKRTLTQVISSAGDRLRARFQERIEERRRVLDFSRTLENIVFDTLTNFADSLDEELKSVTNHYFATVDRSDDKNDYWYKSQIVDVAKSFDYYADTRTYRSWLRLKIKEERQAELVIAFHSLGVEFLGILVASAFLIYRDVNGDNEVTVDGPYAIAKNIFQFAYNEVEDEIRNRFDVWIKDVLLFGIDEWRRQL